MALYDVDQELILIWALVPGAPLGNQPRATECNRAEVPTELHGVLGISQIAPDRDLGPDRKKRGVPDRIHFIRLEPKMFPKHIMSLSLVQ